MAIDIGLLKIDGAVFHQVPTRNTPGPDGKPAQPVLSTVESTLEGQLEFFLRDRLTRTLNEVAQPIIRDEGNLGVRGEHDLAGGRPWAGSVTPMPPL